MLATIFYLLAWSRLVKKSFKIYDDIFLKTNMGYSLRKVKNFSLRLNQVRVD